MKKYYLLTFLLTLTRVSFPQNQALITPFNVKEVSFAKWNTTDGVPYLRLQGANLGVNSFTEINQHQIAFLCGATSEIIIFDTKDGKNIKKVPIKLSPRDFIYEKGLFYVLTESEITVYNEFAEIQNLFPFSNYNAVERLTRFNNATYLLLPSGNSAKVETNGKCVSENYSGWITSIGDFITSQLQGDFTYRITLSRNSAIYSKTFSTEKKVAGVYVIGTTLNRIFLDVQTFISEKPISVERYFISIEIFPDGIGNIISEIKVPNCYYTFSNNDIILKSNGELLNMITSPNGVYVFSLSESKSESIKDYPDYLRNINYHYNYNLLKVD